VKSSAELPSLTLTQRQLCDIELLMNGAFSPLDQFMDQDVYESVVEHLRLGPKYDNAVFPMPIVLDVNKKVSYSRIFGARVARDGLRVFPVCRYCCRRPENRVA
jgi:sulfate adenylyltransferase